MIGGQQTIGKVLLRVKIVVGFVDDRNRILRDQALRVWRDQRMKLWVEVEYLAGVMLAQLGGFALDHSALVDVERAITGVRSKRNDREHPRALRPKQASANNPIRKMWMRQLRSAVRRQRSSGIRQLAEMACSASNAMIASNDERPRQTAEARTGGLRRKRRRPLEPSHELSRSRLPVQASHLCKARVGRQGAKPKLPPAHGAVANGSLQFVQTRQLFLTAAIAFGHGSTRVGSTRRR